MDTKQESDWHMNKKDLNEVKELLEDRINVYKNVYKGSATETTKNKMDPAFSKLILTWLEVIHELPKWSL